MEELVCFCGLWAVFSELRDPDNVWVSVSVAPIHTHKSFLTPDDISCTFRANIFATCRSYLLILEIMILKIIGIKKRFCFQHVRTFLLKYVSEICSVIILASKDISICHTATLSPETCSD